MNHRIKALASWILALAFLCLIVTGFAIWLRLNLGLTFGTLKTIHINVAILAMVAGIAHLYYNLSILCKYVWIRQKGPNMLGTFIVALVITTVVVTASAMMKPIHHGPGHGQGPGGGKHRQGQGPGQGQGHGQGHGQGDGMGRGQGGPGRGMGPGGGMGRGRWTNQSPDSQEPSTEPENE